MEGKGIFVDFDGRQLVVRPKNALAEDQLGTGRLTLDLEMIASATLRPAGLLVEGTLDIVTNDTRRFQLRFARKQQSAFKELYDAVQGVGKRSDPARAEAATAALEPTVRATGYCGQQVVGESHYFAALRKLSGPRKTGERGVIALLRRESNNRHDKNAVIVTIDGHAVGYLPREDAERYQIPLRMLEGQGRPAICNARLWWSQEGGTFIASVSLDIADPASLVPINQPDISSKYVVIPTGRGLQITKENEHMDVLVPIINRAYLPGKAAVYGSLQRVERTGPRSVSQIVTVRIGGREIGELTKQSSAKLIPLLTPMETAGVTCYADVVLTGNSLAIEAKLHITPPEELTPEFVERLELTLNL